MQYRILSSTSPYKLSLEVEEYIKMGWVPQGGVSFQIGLGLYGHDEYVQAMIKEKK